MIAVCLQPGRLLKNEKPPAREWRQFPCYNFIKADFGNRCFHRTIESSATDWLYHPKIALLNYKTAGKVTPDR
jgi:hypothetical protein